MAEKKEKAVKKTKEKGEKKRSAYDFTKADFIHGKEITFSQKAKVVQESHQKKKSGRPKLGLVLAGGGARAILHVGFFHVLKQNGIQVDCITGTSMGAILGSALSLGMSTEELSDILLRHASKFAFRMKDFNYFDSSILKADILRAVVTDIVGDKGFEDLKIPFACIATNLETGREVVFKDKGPLLTPVIASASLPMVFPPVFYGDKYLVDGGVVNNVPCIACKELGAEKLIAISIKNHSLKQYMAGQIFLRHYKPEYFKELLKAKEEKKKKFFDRKKQDFKLFIDIFMQVLQISGKCYLESELRLAKPDLLLEPVSNYQLFDYEKTREIIDLGKKIAWANLDKIRKIAEQ